jgi:hypothetical protein
MQNRRWKMAIQQLYAELRDIPAGVIPATVRAQVLNFIVASWSEFSGCDDTRMDASKIMRDGGPEDVIWNPPNILFTIIRHGATVLGSGSAERQQWKLNLETRTADQSKIGYRRLSPNAPKLDVKYLADHVCKAVLEGPAGASLLVSNGTIVWRNHREVIIKQGKLVGGDNKQTISGRRKRFRTELQTKMAELGWELASVSQGLTFKKLCRRDD